MQETAKTHPLVAGAAACVIASCILAAAAAAGLMPSSLSGKAAIPCASCGTVIAVRSVQGPGSTSGTVIDSQFGHGDGRRALIVLSTAWRITVRMEDDTHRVVSQPEPPLVAVGDRVRVVDGRVIALGAAG